MLSAGQPIDATAYVVFLWQLQQQFKTRFAHLCTNNQVFELFAILFIVTVDSVAIHLQMELIHLQCNTDLKTKFTEVVIIKLSQQYVPAD